jgi:hypothetical protein
VSLKPAAIVREGRVALAALLRRAGVGSLPFFEVAVRLRRFERQLLRYLKDRSGSSASVLLRSSITGAYCPWTAPTGQERTVEALN